MKYNFQIKLMAVRHYLDGRDGYKLTARQYQVPASSLRAWTAAYRLHGQAALLAKTSITYPAHFRAHVADVVLREQLSMRTAAARFNISDYKTVGRWVQEATKATAPAKKERKHMAQKAQKPAKQPEEMTPAELLEEVRYLRAERAYHEKLDALMKAKAEQKKKINAIRALIGEHRLRDLLKSAMLPRSTWYWWQSREAIGCDVALCDIIRQIAIRHKRRYGYRRVTAALHNRGLRVNHKKVSRLMAKMGVQARVRAKKYRSWKGETGMGPAPDLLKREFTASGPGVKLVTDVTEFNVAGSKLYLSPVMDLYNGEIVAMSMGARPTYELTERMLKQLLTSGHARKNALFHSDQGWQYRMRAWQKQVSDAGLRQSMSRKGNCYDNAAMESFFAVLKTEMFHGKTYAGTKELAASIKEYIGYYNRDRIKMKLGGMSPVGYRTHMFP